MILATLLGTSWSHTAVGQTTVEAPSSSSDTIATPSPEATPAPAPSPPAPRDDSDDDKDRDEPKRDRTPTPDQEEASPVDRAPRRTKSRKDPEQGTIWWSLRPSIAGTFDTHRIARVGARLESLGESVRETELYAPFIIAGRAEWSDTWGQARHAEAGKLRPHLGQDVFCDYGAPVLATEPGTVELTTDPLGGLVVKLHRKIGGYFYYAHLARWNDAELSSGEKVDTGDVIGFCGKSGNAATTPPHVHFALVAGGYVNPMQLLVDRLAAAENRAVRKLSRIQKRVIGDAETTTTERLYGEGFLPNLSTITCVANPDPFSLETLGGETFAGLLEAAPAECPGV